MLEIEELSSPVKSTVDLCRLLSLVHLIWAGDKGVVIVALLASRSSSMMDKFQLVISDSCKALPDLSQKIILLLIKAEC